MTSLTIVLSSLLAFLVGFVGNRTTLCAVKAVDEVVTHKRANVFASFIKIAFWVLGILFLFEMFSVVSPARESNYSFGLKSAIGGLIFGVGAVINEGCALQTLIRLGRGNMGMICSLLGLCTGAIVIAFLYDSGVVSAPVKNKNYVEISFIAVAIVVALFLAWALKELFNLFKGISREEWLSRMRQDQYNLSLAAAFLGISNGLLVVFAGTWMYTHVLIGFSTQWFATGQANVAIVHYALAFALLCGVQTSALLNRGIKLQLKPTRYWWRYLGGGLLMGMGAMLIPGGNDVILLNSIPSLSLHAVPSYVAMLFGIFCMLMLRQKRRE